MGKGKVKVKNVTDLDPNSVVDPILLRFDHASVVAPKLNEDGGDSVDVNGYFGAAVFKPLKTEKRKSLAVQAPKKPKQVVAVQNEYLTYIGTKNFDNLTRPSSQDDLLKTYVALKHKKKLRLFEVSPITMSPDLERHWGVPDEPSNDSGHSKTLEERREEQTDLVRSFGTKKARTVYERIRNNQIDSSNMTASINAAINKMGAPSEEVDVKLDPGKTLCPPCNREASSALEVYNLEDFLTTAEMNAPDLEALVDSFLNVAESQMKEWRAHKKYSEYFFAMFRKLRGKGDSRSRKIAKIVVYTEALIGFLKVGSDKIRKIIIEFPKEYPVWMREKVSDCFTTMNANGTRNRSDAYKDKVCCYIMALVLLANDLYFDVPLMSLSLNIHINKLLTLAKAIGITLTYNHATKEYRGMLKLPLPKVNFGRGRKRKPMR